MGEKNQDPNQKDLLDTTKAVFDTFTPEQAQDAQRLIDIGGTALMGEERWEETKDATREFVSNLPKVEDSKWAQAVKENEEQEKEDNKT